jgi:hypothetical protein
MSRLFCFGTRSTPADSLATIAQGADTFNELRALDSRDEKVTRYITEVSI